jgi:hypothetical protein
MYDRRIVLRYVHYAFDRNLLSTEREILYPLRSQL